MAKYKYKAIYKCPMCLTEFTPHKEPVEIEEDLIPELLAGIVKNQMFLGNPSLYKAPMYLPHKCGNGNGGLGQLIGFRKCSWK
jgi:hypothetical protein